MKRSQAKRIVSNPAPITLPTYIYVNRGSGADTAAHEIMHAIQDAFDACEDPWLKEATATWAEDKVYPRTKPNRTTCPTTSAARGSRWTSWPDSTSTAPTSCRSSSPGRTGPMPPS